MALCLVLLSACCYQGATKPTVLSRPCTVGFPGLDPDLEPTRLAKGLTCQKVITSLEPNTYILFIFYFLPCCKRKGTFWGVLPWDNNKIAWHLHKELESLLVHFVCPQSPLPADGASWETGTASDLSGVCGVISNVGGQAGGCGGGLRPFLCLLPGLLPGWSQQWAENLSVPHAPW